MPLTTLVTVKNKNLLTAVRKLLRGILASEGISAVLVPLLSESEHTVMPELVTSPARLDQADPLRPCFALNAARLVSKLTRRPSGKKIAAVLRPCEIRALVELVKLKQARLEDLLMISFDCLGAYSNKDWAAIGGSGSDDFTQNFYETCLSKPAVVNDGPEITAACKSCEYPVSGQADVTIDLIGSNITREIRITGKTDAGESLLRGLNFKSSELPEKREELIRELTDRRLAYKEDMFAWVQKEISPVNRLACFFERCVNCYNCRVACPVCFCRECVFNTDVFDHESSHYIEKARRSGGLRLPSDTLFFHITRMAHISLACVGCGQCSNACPNDIPVMEVFRLVADRAQTGFNYIPGLDVDAPPPLSEFNETEFEEVVGV